MDSYSLLDYWKSIIESCDIHPYIIKGNLIIVMRVERQPTLTQHTVCRPMYKCDTSVYGYYTNCWQVEYSKLTDEKTS